MQIIRQLQMLRERTKLIRESGRTIALVPTMGALHDGHMALVELAARQADEVIVSIFVNPMQFGQNEDFSTYPRTEDSDAARLAEAGVSVLWMPHVSEVYPAGFATTVSVAKLGERWCGAARPGHFDGVATVVAKLLNQIGPDMAIFGEKDWQQLVVIRRVVRDLDLDVEIIGLPVQRDSDGLALSSRNAYLSVTERKAATALPKALDAAAKQMGAGGDVGEALAAAEAAILAAGFAATDYVALVDPDTLEPISALDRPARLLAAARLGATRLIDNIAVFPSGAGES